MEGLSPRAEDAARKGIAAARRAQELLPPSACFRGRDEAFTEDAIVAVVWSRLSRVPEEELTPEQRYYIGAHGLDPDRDDYDLISGAAFSFMRLGRALDLMGRQPDGRTWDTLMNEYPLTTEGFAEACEANACGDDDGYAWYEGTSISSRGIWSTALIHPMRSDVDMMRTATLWYLLPPLNSLTAIEDTILDYSAPLDFDESEVA